MNICHKQNLDLAQAKITLVEGRCEQLVKEREWLHAENLKLQSKLESANANCISLGLHESRMGALEMQMKELENVVDKFSDLSFKQSNDKIEMIDKIQKLEQIVAVLRAALHSAFLTAAYKGKWGKDE